MTAVEIKVLILHPQHLPLLTKQHDLISPNTRRSHEDGTCFDPGLSDFDILRDLDENNLDVTKSTASGEGEDNMVLDEHEHRRKLSDILNELVQYEYRLVESLRILKMIGDNVMEVSSWRETSALREVFKDIPELYTLHQNLADECAQLSIENKDTILPPTFFSEEKVKDLDIYKNFICRYSFNFHKLAHILSKDKDFADFCNSCIITSKFTEQRIQDVFGMYFGVHCSLTRFRLLVSKLKETLLPNDARYHVAEKALNTLGCLLQTSEGEVIRQDQVALAHLAFSKIEGRQVNFAEVPPLLREGPCKKISRRSTRIPTMERHLFLFAGYLVLTDPPNPMGKYQAKSETTLSKLILSDISEDDEIGVPHCFRIKAVNLCVEVAFSSENEKTQWWKAIEKAVEQERPQDTPPAKDDGSSPATLTGSAAVEWVKDEQATMCAECCTEFTVFNRRHHCRACGQVFCGACSDYQAPMAYLGGKLQRVCQADYHLIYGGMIPKTVLSEGTLGRNHKDSQPVQTGHLLWCQYKHGAWSPKPICRSTMSTAHIKHVKITLVDSEFSVPTGACPKQGNTPGVGSEGNQTDCQNHIKGSPTPLKDQQGDSLGIVPMHYAYMSRVFCVLHTDTLFSMFAARADSRPREKLPLLGTRLFYLDVVAEAEPRRSRPRSASCTSTDQSQRTTKMTASPPLFTLVENSRQSSFSNKPSLADRPEPPPVPPRNPMYRNHKPPPVDLASTELLSNEAGSSKQLSGAHLTDSLLPLRVVTHGQSDPGEIGPSSPRAIYAQQGRLKPNIRAICEQLIGNTPGSSSMLVSREDLDKHIQMVSPMVRRILRNQQGFLLLPLNSDCAAYYFEAPTVELRNRWINAIRRVCLDYMQSLQSLTNSPSSDLGARLFSRRSGVGKKLKT